MKNSIPETELSDKMKKAVESSMDGIALLDSSGVYYYLNQVHLSMFGFEEQELIGQNWQVIYDQPEIDRINQEVFPLLLKHKNWKGKL